MESEHLLPEDLINNPDITVNGLIGPARIICEQFLKKILGFREKDRGRLKLIFSGAPGNGKSTVARLLGDALQMTNIYREDRVGRLVTREDAQDWLRTISCGTIFPDWTVKVIEEMEGMNKEVQDIMLMVVDKMPSKSAIIGTTNVNYSDLSEKFQTRFQVIDVGSPDAQEIAELLSRWESQLPAGSISMLAKNARGNVRAALSDAQSAIDANIK